MRILLAGDWHSGLHEEAISKALVSRGHEVSCFKWNTYFSKHSKSFRDAAGWFLERLQNKFLLGPLVTRLNEDLVLYAQKCRPDAILIYRGSHVLKRTVARLVNDHPQAAVVGYNNDDPFSPNYPRWLWRHYLGAVPAYDLVLAYRVGNLHDLRVIGAKRTELWRSWFVADTHRPPVLTEEDLRRYACDVVFVGHYENDGRLDALDLLVKEGVSVRVFGPYKGLGASGWHGKIERSRYLREQGPTQYLYGGEYVKAIGSAKIALCFLSKLNRDTYTRRCFEIPAIGTALFSEYSSDLESLFLEGKEAEFFRSPEELAMKVRLYLANREQLVSLAKNGERRVHADGHDIEGRVAQLEKWFEEIRRTKS